MAQVKIQFLRNEQIDKGKWDACIRLSLNSMMYAQSGYLDAMADHWDALIYGDYEAVMPLTWRKKFGIRYLYQPAYTQQLGIFSPHPLQEDLLQLFIQTARKQFRFCEIFLNYENQIKHANNLSCTLMNRTNFTLKLDRPHEEIQHEYKDSLVQDINKAVKNGLMYLHDVEFRRIIDENKDFLSGKSTAIHKKDFNRFYILCDRLKANGMCFSRGVKGNGGELLAKVILLKDHARIYNIMSVTTAKGRELRANHFLYDSILKEFECSGWIFDFEGSDLPGVNMFYKSFGGINQPYYFLKYNDLPGWLRIFKK